MMDQFDKSEEPMSDNNVQPVHESMGSTRSTRETQNAAETPAKPRKQIRVVGAAIVRDGKVMCAQRGGGKQLSGKWEFPGGKIEPHETPREALHREIEEELLCEVEIGDEVCTDSYDYDFGTVTLTVFICHLLSGEPRRTEHQEFRWLDPADMPTLDWAPADHKAVSLISAMSFARR